MKLGGGCCVSAVGAEAPTAETPLEDTLSALDLKLRSLQYQCTQCTLRAKQFKAQGDVLRCKQELRARREKELVYARWLALYANVCRVRDSIDNAGVIGDVSATLGVAETSLKEALLKVNVEKIDDLMDRLSEGMEGVNEAGEALARELRGEEFDAERAMEELELEEPAQPAPPIPESLPTKKKKVFA